MAANEDYEESLLNILNFQRNGDTWRAMERLKQMCQEHPKNALFHKILANIYFNMGLIDWAVDYYQKTIEIDPNYIDAHFELGIAYYHRARIKDAIDEFQTVLQLDPQYHSAHYRLGLCYHHAGKLNAALHHLHESTVITPEYIMAHYHLGVIYYKQEEFEKAQAEFRRVLEEDPENFTSARYLELIKNRSEAPDDAL